MYTHVQGFSGQIVHLKLKWTHPTDNGWKKPWPKQLWQILVWRLRFSEGLWEASPKSWFFLFPWERHKVRLGEAVNTTSHLGGQLRAVGFVAWRPSRWPLSSSVLGPECYQPPASVPSAPHSTRVGPQRLIQELSEKESEFCTSDLHGRVFHMGLDSTQCDFSFPLSLIQIGTRFFLVDHSCPDVAIFFFIFL